MTLNELRQQLLDLLMRWEQSIASTRDVHEAAEQLLSEWDWTSHARSDEGSIVNEVLAQMDALNVQRIVPDDIPAIRAFLASPPGSELQAWAVWESYWAAVDQDERARLLRGNPVYGL